MWAVLDVPPSFSALRKIFRNTLLLKIYIQLINIQLGRIRGYQFLVSFMIKFPHSRKGCKMLKSY